MIAPLRLSVQEACIALGLSKTSLFERIKSGRLHASKDGGRTFITRAEIERYVAACESSTTKPQRSGFVVGSRVGDTL
ncbi:MAG: hypothetical protein DI536_14140 [Archangium gephyra]|uniref:Helix-turn-helix domain-containing protein n=1 Tax=Archangium gephyra TaxID=48 RepID=A0A2W5THH9_9BACT|nr:MAG: hypothetical protein DI536_14140 [Archangium gephyra]